jgi:carbon monoxide dehydrogenase subunit G
MKVQLEKTFALPASADTAWKLLQNIEAVAGCMPGAKITERIDAQHYKGTVAVKFGPASMSFRGELEVIELEPATRTLHLIGKGTDSTGGSGASMDLTARVEAVDAASSNLLGSSEVSMSGKAAAFGGRMMNTVADQVLKQFADNFAIRTRALQAEIAAPPADTLNAESGKRASSTAPPPPTQLNGLALIWVVIKDWLRSLFTAKRA